MNKPEYDHELKLQMSQFQPAIEGKLKQIKVQTHGEVFKIGQNVLFKEWNPAGGYSDRAFSTKILGIAYCGETALLAVK